MRTFENSQRLEFLKRNLRNIMDWWRHTSTYTHTHTQVSHSPNAHKGVVWKSHSLARVSTSKLSVVPHLNPNPNPNPNPSKSIHPLHFILSYHVTTKKNLLFFGRDTLSAGSHPRRTSKAVIVVPNADIGQFVQRLNIKDGFSTLVNAIDSNGIAQLLIEIAIVNLRNTK
jgi:hypothetical protein